MHAAGPPTKPTSWTARVLAPLALAVTALVVVLIVSGTLSDGNDEGGKRASGETTTRACVPDAQDAVEAGYYVIKPGDLLSTVAEKTCIDVERLERLNPNLDPQLLPENACVDLRPDGCKALAEG